MKLVKQIKNFFKENRYTVEWKIFYRKCPTASILNWREERFVELKMPFRCWGADPLLFENDNGEQLLFFELFKKRDKKGVIGFVNFEEKERKKIKIVLEEKCHLSFPFVFKNNNNYFLIPETASLKELALYSASNFPYSWHKIKAFDKGLEFCDTIFVNGRIITSVCDGNACNCYAKHYSFQNVNSIKTLFETKSGTDGIRNAGGIFKYDGHYFRVGQCANDNGYGAELVFYKLDSDFRDLEIVKRITPADIAIKSKQKFLGIHTYSSSSKYEFVDLKVKKRNNTFVIIAILFSRTFSRLKRGTK